MRVRVLRFDIWLTLLISFAISFIPAKILESVLPKQYESYLEEHTVTAGEIGGEAGEEVFRAQSVEDLLSHDTFTVVSPGIQHRNNNIEIVVEDTIMDYICMQLHSHQEK